MAYKLRDRKQKTTYISSSSSSECESDSSYTDPDYITRPQRRTQSNSIRITDAAEMQEARVVRRGRPPMRRANGEEEAESSQKRRKKQASFSRPSTSNRDSRYEVKRTILSWMIDLEVLEENEKVYYKNGGRDMELLEGRITRAGVLCSCCNQEITLYEFENHAGSDNGWPYENIFLANSRESLVICQLKALKSREEMALHAFNLVQPQNGATDKNDDACMICADGGDLICCERCPSTFHPSCMDMERIPQDDWMCPFCICKYCDSGDGDLYACVQCQKKYHWECFRGTGMLDLNSPSTSLCGNSCREIYEKLIRMIGVRKKLDEVLSWTLIRLIAPGSDLFSENPRRTVECNSKVAVAWGLMNDCFLPYMDRHTKINVVQSVVYNRGSNLTRINFNGFYTAILEMGDEIISAASLRIHGPKLAEMPYIATLEKYRLTGMSRKLMLAIESALCFLKVENLVIPSVTDLASMWTEKYQFSHIQESLKKEILQSNTLMFPRTVRLQKTLLLHAAEPIVANTRAVMEVVAEEQNNENQNELAADENAARSAILDLNLEPTLLDLNLEPPKDNKV